jgi:uncharacterized Zn finger protein (UPF0148 family)
MANSFTSCPNCGTPIPSEDSGKEAGADRAKLEKRIRAEMEEQFSAELSGLRAELREKSSQTEKLRQIEAELKRRESALVQRENDLLEEGERAHDKKKKKGGQAAVDYLVGSEFKPRLEGLIASIKSIKDDLENERAVLEKLWEKRMKQIQAALKNTAGLYGDLQVGSSLAKARSSELTSGHESEI